MESRVQVTCSEPTSPAVESSVLCRTPSKASSAHVPSSTSRTLTKVNSRSSSFSRKSSRVPLERCLWWTLHLQANVWRFLEQIGTWLHQMPEPTPPQPSFIRQCSTQVVGKHEEAIIELVFYVREDYTQRMNRGEKHPVVVNLHGGGFTLGTARDDARWAAIVLEQTSAIFVSVEYRLAPEHPFPTGVEDGVAALLHLAAHADEYGIDPNQMALSGFSAGGNMAFTIPLRLQVHLQSIKNEITSKFLHSAPYEPVLPRIVCIIAWYPSLDQRLTRAERRAACSRPDKTLPDMLTSLFDKAWLPDSESKISPFASPAAATDEALHYALPQKIAMYLCEWDMLFQEGWDFYERLMKLGKKVHCTVIEETQHAFDKSPNPFSLDPKVALHYRQACEVLRDAFGDGASGSRVSVLELEAITAEA